MGRIWVVAPDGSSKKVFVSSGISQANGLVFDASRNTFFTACYGPGTVYSVSPTGVVTTFVTGLSMPQGLRFNASGTLFTASLGLNGVYALPSGGVKILAASLSSSQDVIFDENGAMWVTSSSTGAIWVYPQNCNVGVLALSGLSKPWGLAINGSGTIFFSENMGNRVQRILPTFVPSCSPTPTRTVSRTASLYSSATSTITPSRSPVVTPSPTPSPCLAGYVCSVNNSTLCPTGSFCISGTATPCPAGTFTSTAGSSSCQPCPGGHYCPAGTSSWARLNCGRANYCPDGSGAPTPCPFQVPPTGGWGALQAQGPAFLVETARCLNHCFLNFTSGDGMLSNC